MTKTLIDALLSNLKKRFDLYRHSRSQREADTNLALLIEDMNCTNASLTKNHPKFRFDNPVATIHHLRNHRAKPKPTQNPR